MTKVFESLYTPAVKSETPDFITTDKLKLTFSVLANLKINYLSFLGKTEVGFFGISSPDNLLYVEDVVLPKQLCSAASVDFTDDGLVDLQFDMDEKDIPPERYKRIWIHTHPGELRPNPSGTDEHTFKELFAEMPWSAMVIFSQKHGTYGSLQFTTGPRLRTNLPVVVDSYASLPKEVEKLLQSGDHDIFRQWREDYFNKVDEKVFTYTSGGLYKTPDGKWVPGNSNSFANPIPVYPNYSSYVHTGGSTNESTLFNPYTHKTYESNGKQYEYYIDKLTVEHIENVALLSSMTISEFKQKLLNSPDDDVEALLAFADGLGKDDNLALFSFNSQEIKVAKEVLGSTQEDIDAALARRDRDQLVATLKAINEHLGYDVDFSKHRADIVVDWKASWVPYYMGYDYTADLDPGDLDYGTEKEERRAKQAMQKAEEAEQVRHLFGGVDTPRKKKKRKR